MSSQLIDILELVNQALSAAIIITGFSLLLYLLTLNLRERPARAFSLLLGSVVIVYFCDLVLYQVPSPKAAELWLRLQWVGIAFVPATYLHLSDALRATTNDRSRRRQMAVISAYLISAIACILALASDWLVSDGIDFPNVPHLQAGPLFGLFAVYFFVAVSWGLLNTRTARDRCLTPTTHRRMSYLMWAFIFPALGVFPYILFASAEPLRQAFSFWSVVILSNIGVFIMILVMAYAIAYIGALVPDRVVRARLVKWLVRGPFLVTATLVATMIVRRVGPLLGIPSETAVLMVMVGVILLGQWVIMVGKRQLERGLYFEERDEVGRIQELQDRLLTSRDLQQYLESVLAAMCDLMRSQNGFVASITPDGPRLEVVIGRLQPLSELWDSESWRTATEPNGEAQKFDTEQEMPRHNPVMRLSSRLSGNGNRLPVLHRSGNILVWDGYWLFPLSTRSGEPGLGVLGVAARSTEPNLSPEEYETAWVLANRAANALEDRLLQQEVFGSLAGLIPEIEALQRRRATARFGGVPALTAEDENELLISPDFVQFVRDALSHYWGGPKLTESPLLKLRLVENALRQYDSNPSRALRAVLAEAIEHLRPDGQRSMTTTEWILYNILELKFVQGQKVRDIALRLAMSESDLYRKQRIAVEEVARVVAEMERSARQREVRKPEQT